MAAVAGRNGRMLLLGVALVNMAAALIFSESRGGILSFAGALLFFSLLLCLLRGEGRRLAIAIPVLMSFVLAYALWLGIDHVIERFIALESGDDRSAYWSATFRLIGEFPLLGTGLGTYVYGFRRHTPLLGPVLLDHAHSDYLELLAEAGALGFMIVMAGFGWFGWHTLTRWFARRDPEVRGIVLGGLASVVAMGIHSVVDFNLHVPANALLLAVILGLISVVVHLRHQHGRSIAIFRARELRLPRPLRLALYPLAALLTLALAWPTAQSVAADQHARLAERIERGARGIAELETLVEQRSHAVALDPGDADYHYSLGLAYDRTMRAQWSSDPSRALAAGVQAMAAYREAILRNPTSPFPYLGWGLALENMRRLAAWAVEQRGLMVVHSPLGENDLRDLITQLARHPERAAQRSKQLMETVTHLAPTAAFAHHSAGMYALQQWTALSAEEQARAVQELRLAAQLEPRYRAAILQTLWERTKDGDLVRALAWGTPEEARWRAYSTHDPPPR